MPSRSRGSAIPEPGTGKPDAVEFAEHFRTRACEYAKRGEFSKASALLTRVLRDGELPLADQADVRLELAHALECQHRFPEAVATLKAYLRLPEDVARPYLAYDQMGMILKRQGKYDDAVKFYRRALRDNHPHPGDVHHRIGAAYLAANQIRKAIRSYEEASRQPGTVHNWQTWRSLGICYLKVHEPEKALKLLNEASNTGLVDIPGNVSLHIGGAYLQLDDIRNAMLFFKETSSDEQPDTSGSGHLKLGQCYSALGYVAKAEGEYRLAEAKFLEAHERRILSKHSLDGKLSEIRRRLSELPRSRISRCYAHSGECSHKDRQPEPHSIFLATPIGKESTDEWTEFVNLRDCAVRPAADKFGLSCIRADEIQDAGSVMCQICQCIQVSGIVVADLTEPNLNVYYEVGMAHALNKEVVLIAKSVDKVPFDLQGDRVLPYRSLSELREALEAQFRRLLPTV